MVILCHTGSFPWQVSYRRVNEFTTRDVYLKNQYLTTLTTPNLFTATEVSKEEYYAQFEEDEEFNYAD